MKLTADQLPDDIAALKQQVLALHQEIALLREKLNLALAKRFGPSSEKAPQLGLFNEAEASADLEEHAQDEEAAEQPLEVPPKARRKRGRRPLPEYLPRVEVIHELPEAERFCPHDGLPLKEIGREISEQLEIIPAKVQVIRHVRIKYGCSCEQCVTTAPLPPQPLPKSLATPATLAYVATSKYADALPLYRLSNILERADIDISRTTLANWMVGAGRLVQSVINLLEEQALAYDILQMDETTVQVLDEPGRSATSKSYMWVRRGGPPDQTVILFEYAPSRSAEVARRLLGEFTGYLQTDGYDAYGRACAGRPIIQLGCWAHARRKFDEALKGAGKPKAGRVTHALNLISRLYGVEGRVRQASAEERHQVRQERARPILDEIRAWLEKTRPEVPPATALGKALTYLHNQWESLIHYLDDGRLEIDNNATERTIRPFVIGRRNWLFSATVEGAKASANLYSLIETAKANGHEPYAYLCHIFKELPRAKCAEDIEKLLPYSLSPADLT